MFQEFSRRNLLKSSAVATMSVFSGGALANASIKTNSKQNTNLAFDVVVLGAGTAGLIAAIRAADKGAKVAVLEKCERPDGNSIYAMGTIYAWGSKEQITAGIKDSRDAFYQSMMDISSYRADPVLTAIYADKIGPGVDWLQEVIGIPFDKPSNNRARFRMVEGEGLTGGGNLIKKLLVAVAKRKNINIFYEHKAVELVTNDAGAVTGVIAQTSENKLYFAAKGGVLIATGGFSANEEMTDRYIGGWASRLALRGSRNTTGENISLTLPLFAKMVNMDQFHAGPIIASTHVNPNRILNSGRGVIVDLRGHRFVDEAETYVIKSKACAEKTLENKAWCIVDSTCPALKTMLPRFDRLNSPYTKGETLEDLCKATGLPVAAVKATVQAFNEGVEKGTLLQMTPSCSYKKPVKLHQTPFYAIPYEGGMTATFGGPLIDAKARVLNLERKPIEGLYAAGNAAGGLFFRNYHGGSQLGAATVFGSIAGLEMAQRAKAA